MTKKLKRGDFVWVHSPTEYEDLCRRKYGARILHLDEALWQASRVVGLVIKILTKSSRVKVYTQHDEFLFPKIEEIETPSDTERNQKVQAVMNEIGCQLAKLTFLLS